jgi:hypothetical protein
MKHKMNDIVTLKSLSALAIENEADFEVFHGKTTHKDKRVRAQMILSLTGCPEVRVSFGDSKHGQRINAITLAGNNKIVVKQEHLLAVLEDHRTSADWRRVMTGETPLFNINTAEDNRISIAANIIKRLSSETIIPGNGEAETWDEFEVQISNHVMVTHSVDSEPVEIEPTKFYVKSSRTKTPELLEMWEEGLEGAELVGEYIFPNTMVFNRFKTNPANYWSGSK